MLIEVFDVEALKRDRDQLWAEAAHREAQGGSIRLAPELWSAAAAEQAERTVAEPFLEDLAKHLDGFEGKILSSDVRVILDIRNPTQDHTARIGKAMRELGWTYKKASFGGSKGATTHDAKYKTITVIRDKDDLMIFQPDKDEPAPAQPAAVQSDWVARFGKDA